MSNVQQITQHPEYYINGGDLYIVVDHTMFCVHSYFFQRESQRFRDIMASPAPKVQGFRQGETDTSAILLKDVSVEDFAKFLWVFYNRVYADYTATLLEWISILKLAHEYQFPEVKRLAIRELEDVEIPIAERIVLYQNHKVDPVHLVPLYVKLCMRDEGPTDDETAIMGMTTALIIFRARERLRFRPSSGTKNASSPPDENDITRTIYSLLNFDYNGQSGLVPHRRPATKSVPARIPRGEASSRTIGDPEVVPENETNLRGTDDAEENSLVAKENCGYMEIGQKELIVVSVGEGSTFTGAVAIFMVIPARTFLLFFALLWTLFLLYVIRDFPSNIRIL